MCCLFCAGAGCEVCKPAPATPDWFTAGKNTPKLHIDNVARGYHPVGYPLLVGSGHSCGDCLHRLTITHHSKAYHKCILIPVTHGHGTDIRKSWPACVRWQPHSKEKDGLGT